MESELYFRSDNDTIQDYIDKADKIFSKYVDKFTLIVGHQISSDLHTFLHCSAKEQKTISSLILGFKNRKQNSLFPSIHVADTRYDIKNRVTGNGAEKLRNVSIRLNVFAVQTELDDISLTRMYNDYLLDRNDLKREKLTIMNWRHAFQTALIWLVDSLGTPPVNLKFNSRFLVTNDIMFEMGNSSISYLNSDEYNFTRSIEGIDRYLKKYCPELDLKSFQYEK